MTQIISKLKGLPLGALVVLILMGASMTAGATLIYIGLTVPGDGTVVNTNVETAGFSSSVANFHFGDFNATDPSAFITFTVTNVQPNSAVLHVYATNLPTGVSMAVEYQNGVDFTPLSLTAGQSVILKACLVGDDQADEGHFVFTIHMD